MTQHTATNDGVNVQRANLLGVASDQLAEVGPELVLALVLQRREVVVVHQARQQHGGLVVATRLAQELMMSERDEKKQAKNVRTQLSEREKMTQGT